MSADVGGGPRRDTLASLDGRFGGDTPGRLGGVRYHLYKQAEMIRAMMPPVVPMMVSMTVQVCSVCFFVMPR